MNPDGEYSHRKALLIAKADLERLKLRYSLREIKHTIHPPSNVVPAKWVSPVANTLMVLALPALGTERISQILRMVSTGMLAYRIFNKWQEKQ